MSLEELKSDFQSVSQQLSKLNPALTTAPDLIVFMKMNLVPLVENVITELAEIDETVHDIYNGAEDILQTETGGQLAATVAGAIGIIQQLKTRLVPTVIADAQMLKAIKEWEKLAADASEIIAEITIPPDDDDELEDDDDSDDEDGDDDEDQDDDADEGDDDEEEAK